MQPRRTGCWTLELAAASRAGASIDARFHAVIARGPPRTGIARAATATTSWCGLAARTGARRPAAT